MNVTCPVYDHSTCALFCNASARALQSLDDSIPSSNRTVWNIIWSSLTTLFACTWVAWHPNIPGIDETWLQRKARRIKVFAIALLAPEVVALCAIRQFVAARAMGREMWTFFEKQGIEKEPAGRKMTTTHGFLIIMGGCVWSYDNGDARIWMPEPGDYDQFPALKTLREDDINDRSKQDWLAKAFVLVQTTWFVTQCLARKVGSIAITELELTVCAYAVLSAVIYGFWWKKPFDVSSPILISRGSETAKDLHRLGWFDEVGGSLFGAGGYDKIGFDRRSRVPTFYSGRLSVGQDIRIFLAEASIAAVFGGIHLIAWNFEFPTHVEQILWRVSAIAFTTIPVSLLAVGILIIATDETIMEQAFVVASIFIFAISIPIYVVARLILLAIAFSSLRALPTGAFAVVNWTTFIPHIS